MKDSNWRTPQQPNDIGIPLSTDSRKVSFTDLEVTHKICVNLFVWAMLPNRL